MTEPWERMLDEAPEAPEEFTRTRDFRIIDRIRIAMAGLDFM
jgi:hypothetical protein